MLNQKARKASGCMNLIGDAFKALLFIAVIGVLVIGMPALGIYNLTEHYRHTGDRLLPRYGPDKAKPAAADTALAPNCRPDGECPQADVTVYRQDEGPFHDYLRLIIIQSAGAYAVDDEGVYYAKLPPERVRELLDMAEAPIRQGVTDGYADWAKQASAEAAPMPSTEYYGIYITVTGHCPNCLFGGWFLLIAGLIVIAFIAGAIYVGIDTASKSNTR